MSTLEERIQALQRGGSAAVRQLDRPQPVAGSRSARFAASGEDAEDEGGVSAEAPSSSSNAPTAGPPGPTPVTAQPPAAPRTARFAPARAGAQAAPLKKTTSAPAASGPTIPTIVQPESAVVAPPDGPPIAGPFEPWTDESIPRGSGFTAAQWLEAETAAQTVGANDGETRSVFELIKGQERSLISLPAKEPLLADLLARSLLIDERLIPNRAAWARNLQNATITFNSPQMGVFRFLVIRSEQRRKEAPWLDGSKLQMSLGGAAYADQDKPKSAPTPPRARQRYT